VKVAATAARIVGSVDDPEPLVVPIGQDECERCPYELWCAEQMGPEDPSAAITRGRLDMMTMEYGLRMQGFQTVNWGYNSVRRTIPELADDMAEGLKPYSGHRVHLVCHSMGGIVSRVYLDKFKPRNIGRMVMIGTPNRGAALADMFSSTTAYRLFFGPAGLQLQTGDAGLCESAGIPECEFGIIAGGRGNSKGFFSVIPGDDDTIVEVESTRLKGARDFILVPYIHANIQSMPRTIRETAYFLRHGRFTEGANRPAPPGR
jgi:pimeloyl-ACP methyl ester carboxylesterase